MQIELTDDKKSCYMIGYITKKAIEINPAFQEILQSKIIKGTTYFDKKVLDKIYVESVKILTSNDAVTDDINQLLEYTSLLLLQADNDALSKYDVSYYFTLGLTSAKVTIDDGNVNIL